MASPLLLRLYSGRFAQDVAPQQYSLTLAHYPFTMPSAILSQLLAIYFISFGFIPVLGNPLVEDRAVTWPNGCSTISFAFNYCSSVTPNFESLASTLRAPCLCYS